MGAAEARALWQRTASRCFSVHEDTKMAPMLACCQQQHNHHSCSSNTEKNSFCSGSFGDSSDFSYDTKWWLKGSTGFDEEITNSLFEDTKCKKLQEFVDMIEINEKEEGYYSFVSEKANATTPWWKSKMDKDELALLVATRSIDHNIQNCDLPPTQKLIHKRIRCTSGEKGFQTAVKSPWKEGVWGDQFERALSYNSSTESPISSTRSDDLSKAQLLEALRHSQTRAREAEKAAKEACAEKDRLVTIMLRQASQMLAYKQWLKLVEMEAVYLQREKEEGVEEQIKGVNLKKRKQRRKKKKKKVGYMMAYALGFSLIGAGLLLGWTVGWFLTL